MNAALQAINTYLHLQHSSFPELVTVDCVQSCSMANIMKKKKCDIEEKKRLGEIKKIGVYNFFIFGLRVGEERCHDTQYSNCKFTFFFFTTPLLSTATTSAQAP